MPSGRIWTLEEKNYLKENYGIRSLIYIAGKLNRTPMAAKLKVKRMKLGASTKADEYMTAHQVALLLGVDGHIVVRWILNHQLKARKKVTLFVKEFWLIKHCNLCQWLENNQDRFDSRRIELFALGYEPEWLQEKRKKDRKLPKNRFKKWTSFEVQKILLYAKDMNYQKIALMMGRSYDSIERKFGRLKYTEV